MPGGEIGHRTSRVTAAGSTAPKESWNPGSRLSIPAILFVDRMRAGNLPPHSEGDLMASQSQYLLSVFMNEADQAPSDVDMQRIYQQVEEVNNEMKSAGAWVFAGGLHPSNTATVVRTENGSPVTTDGPYAETKEQLGGFW